MVERRETDPVRVAQLLASEVTGRTCGPLAALTVVDAEEDATPASGGTVAYRLAVADDGEPAGTVALYPDHVLVSIDADGPLATAPAVTAAIPADRDTLSSSRDEEGIEIEVRTGAAVKPAVDALHAATAVRDGERPTDVRS